MFRCLIDPRARKKTNDIQEMKNTNTKSSSSKQKIILWNGWEGTWKLNVHKSNVIQLGHCRFAIWTEMHMVPKVIRHGCAVNTIQNTWITLIKKNTSDINLMDLHRPYKSLTEALHKSHPLQNTEATTVLDVLPYNQIISSFHQIYTLHKPYIGLT